MYQDCLDCAPVFHKIITPAYLLYRSRPVAIYYSEIYSLFYGSGHTVTLSLLTLFVSFAGRPKNYSYATAVHIRKYTKKVQHMNKLQTGFRMDAERTF